MQWSQLRVCTLIAAFVTVLPSVQSVCQQGDLLAGGSCYFYYTQAKADAVTANRICTLKKSSTLRVVSHSAENITSHFGVRTKDVWLGIQRDTTSSAFYFTDGTLCPTSTCLNSTFWASGHPRSSSKRLCVGAKVSSGVYRWRSRNCNVKRRVICEYASLPSAPVNVSTVCGLPSQTTTHTQLYTSASSGFCSLSANDSVGAVTQQAKSSIQSVGDIATVVNFAAEKALEVASNLNLTTSRREADELLDLFDVILDQNNAKHLTTLSASSSLLPDLMDTMEFFASTLAHNLNGNNSIELDKSNFYLRTDIVNRSSTGFVMTAASGSSQSASVSVSSVSGFISDSLTVSFIAYKNIINQFPAPDLDGKRFQFTSQRIVAVSLYSDFAKVRATTDFVVPRRSAMQAADSVRCVFLDTENSTNGASWSSYGCSAVMINSSHVTCVCNHTTNYAVLTQVTDVQPSAYDLNILSIITYIGTALSIACLIASLVIFVITSNTQVLRLKIHKCLCVSLLLFQSAFLLGGLAAENRIGCAIVGVLTQYLGLATFMWMLVEAIHLLRNIIFVYGGESASMLKYHLLAWLCPLGPVGIGLAISHSDYGFKQGTCWLNNQLIWSFVAPVILITVFNFITMVLVIRTVVKASAGQTKLSVHQVKTAIKSFVLIAPLLGLTWIFGVLAFTPELLFFHYVFALTNTLQGVFILVFCVCLSSEVRGSLQRKLKRRREQSRDFSKKNSSKLASSDSGNSGRVLLPTNSTPVSALSTSGYESDEFTSVSRIPSAAASVNKGFQPTEMCEISDPNGSVQLRPPTPLKATQDVSLKVAPSHRPSTQESLFSINMMSDADNGAPGTPDYTSGELLSIASRPVSASSRPGSSGSARVSSPLTPATKPAAVVRPLRRTKRQLPTTVAPVTRPWLSDQQSATAEVDYVLTGQKVQLHSKKKKKATKKSSVRPPTPQKQNITPRTILYDMEEI